ncbi:MAG: hypothetical protein MZV64_33030 [Ignavibacteriales bacterium]|nr:hypothetical protein [Ignavibacteriales bacterium]
MTILQFAETINRIDGQPGGHHVSSRTRAVSATRNSAAPISPARERS